MKAFRIGGLFALLFTLSAASLWWFVWWSWTPMQRAYARPAVEAVAGSWVSVDVPMTSISFAPRVAAVLHDPAAGRVQWMRLPAPQMTASLRSLYPVPIATVLPRIAAITAAQAAVLYLLLLVLARSIARHDHNHRGAGAPPGRV